MTTESNTITEGKCEFTNAMVYTELSHDQKTLVDSVSERDRIKAAERGFGLDKLIDDECKVVRMAACCAMSICKCTEEHWEGEGWYTFRTWLKTDGKFTVEDWESPEKPDPIFIESKDKFMEACKVPEGCECIVEHLNSDYELRSETMEIPEGWDCTESEDYERLAKILCERNGLFYDKNNWKD